MNDIILLLGSDVCNLILAFEMKLSLRHLHFVNTKINENLSKKTKSLVREFLYIDNYVSKTFTFYLLIFYFFLSTVKPL